MSTLIKNIRSLVGVRNDHCLLRGKALSHLPVLHDAYLLVEGGKIAAYGAMRHLDSEVSQKPSDVVDASSRIVMPAWCDSHSHLVFYGSREMEFVDKIKGLSYAEIAAKGGGILNSATRISQVSEDELFNIAWNRLTEVSKLGTGSIEIKSGYGLSMEAELKMLRVIKKLKQCSGMLIRSTFLGAHTFPIAFRENHEGYIHSLINDMLPVIANEGLADYIDVFCEKGFFSPEEMERICIAGMKYGLKPKLHVNQLNSFGGLQKAIELNALSVDHLETMTEDDIKELAASDTIGTLLPTAAFFLRMPYQPARKMIDSGCAIALASDFNPGSSPSGNMNFVVSLSCIQMKMLPEEAINAATINGAYAMGLEDVTGSISVGKRADLIITSKIPGIEYIPYAFGSNLIHNVMINGEFLY